jgi:hypothetical protein
LPDPPRGLERRIETALQLYPCDLLFVHRDGDRAGLHQRREEVRAALAGLPEQPAVAVVPVRTQEAWLLLNEAAIRTAAGNPNGREPLDLPVPNRLEELVDPKRRLHEILRAGSGLGPRRRSSLRLGPAVHRIAELVEDFSPLRLLAAFQVFEDELANVLTDCGWRRGTR